MLLQVTRSRFLWTYNNNQGLAPQKRKITKFLEKFKILRSEKALQRHIGFLKYYRIYRPGLAERFRTQKMDAKAKFPNTPGIVKEFMETNEALDRCCQLAPRQPLPGKQLILMTAASFLAAGYAVLIEDDPKAREDTLLPKSRCPSTQKNF